MLYVRIEIWPFGDRTKARLLQEVTIVNTDEGEGDKGVYRAAMSHSSTFRGTGHLAGEPELHPEHDRRPDCTWKEVPGGIRHFRKRSPVELVAKAIQALLWA